VQLHGDPPLWQKLAAALQEWGADSVGKCGYSAVGAVVGATHAQELADLREALPRSPLLLPGYGAQGAGAEQLSVVFPDAACRWRGGLINASRSIAFAYRDPAHQGHSWQEASRAALDAMIEDVRSALGLPAPSHRTP
jgi:orotidine-5'-phosphate decarboxylase